MPVQTPIPIRLPGSFPPNVPQPRGYNSSPLPPPADYYVSRKELLEIVPYLGVMKSVPSAANDTVVLFDDKGQVKSSGVKLSDKADTETVETLVGGDGGKSAREIAKEEVNQLLGEDPNELYDTFTEVSKFIGEAKQNYQAINNALSEEVTRATQSEAQIDGKINTIIADDAGKSARTIAAEEVAKVVANAPADFDTLKEIAEYIESDKTGAAQMVTKIDANANAISAEAQRAQDAEAALRQAVEGKVDVVEGKGLSANDYTDAEKSKLAGIAAGAQVNPTPIAPVNATESGMFADAYWTKQDLAGKADKVAYAIDGNLAAIDSNGNLTDSGMALRDFAVAESLAPAFVAGVAYEVGDLCTSFDNDEQHKGAWLYKCILATDGSQPTSPEIDPTHWALATVGDLLAALRRTVEGKVDVVEGKGLSTNDYTNEDKAKLGKAYTPDNPPPAPDLSGYATKVAVEQLQVSVDSISSAYESVSEALTVINNKADAALPRYYFTVLEIVGGVLTVPPYTSACIPGSPETAFTIAVGEGNSMYLRDCILCVQCGDVAPTITWPANFHPRTDAVTDFACVAGAMNVYWISEYAQGEFAVAGWQATAGGSAV